MWRDVLPAMLLPCKLLTFSAWLLGDKAVAAPLNGASSSPNSLSPSPAVVAAPSPNPATAAGDADAAVSVNTALRTKYTPRLTLRAKLIAAAYIAEALYWLAACAWVEPALHSDGYGMDAGLGPCTPTRSTAWRRQVSCSNLPACLPACFLRRVSASLPACRSCCRAACLPACRIRPDWLAECHGCRCLSIDCIFRIKLSQVKIVTQ
jgi:hypothetical protein